MDTPLLRMITCSLYIGVLVWFAVMHGNHLCCSILVMIVQSPNFLEQAYIFGNIYERMQFKKCTPTRKINLAKALNKYQVTFLIWREFLQFIYLFVPTFMFCGYCMNVICTFSLIRLHSQLPFSVLGILAVYSAILTAGTVGIHKYALTIVYEVDNFFYYWKTEFIGAKWRKILRAGLPIRVQIGPFFHLTPGTLVSIFMQVVDMTVTMLYA